MIVRPWKIPKPGKWRRYFILILKILSCLWTWYSNIIAKRNLHIEIMIDFCWILDNLISISAFNYCCLKLQPNILIYINIILIYLFTTCYVSKAAFLYRNFNFLGLLDPTALHMYIQLHFLQWFFLVWLLIYRVLIKCCFFPRILESLPPLSRQQKK